MGKLLSHFLMQVSKDKNVGDYALRVRARNVGNARVARKPGDRAGQMIENLLCTGNGASSR